MVSSLRGPTGISLVLLGVGWCLSGCAQDYGFAPPSNSQLVTVQVRVHPDLVAEKLEVMYRSASCKRTRRDARGEPYEVDGFHEIDVLPQKNGSTDIYEARIFKDGGGECRWKLSNVTFGVAYKEPTPFGDGVRYGAGGGVVVMFDEHDSPHGGADIEASGNLLIKKDYYPWVSESYIGGYRKEVSLAGRGDIYAKYRTSDADSVYFEPILHTDMVVSSEQPKVHKKGLFTIFKYPDGTVVADGHSEPDILRLEAIRLKSENRQ
ncbi:hypothetical protein IB274_14540 [Pseudomonas sp. PDM18]|uniref:hypothetical protein n=1 Tax=Pseudomonas sp. PDM18 TaxID=2769253 RepID=UPI001784C93D|nr:hypothetical protein [Pseudomonas sp. PDM18]MBD9677928.1 hypothetical protein [Pseudomonas sp. PDM18]